MLEQWLSLNKEINWGENNRIILLLSVSDLLKHLNVVLILSWSLCETECRTSTISL